MAICESISAETSDARLAESNQLRPWRPESVGYWVILLGGTVLNQLERALRPFGISPVQFAILDMCYRGEANTVSSISQVIPFDSSNVSRQVEQLCKSGRLSRRRWQSDRRVVELSLTEDGKELMHQLIQVVTGEEARNMAGISNDEKMTLVSLMRRLVEDFEGRRSQGEM